MKLALDDWGTFLLIGTNFNARDKANFRAFVLKSTCLNFVSINWASFKGFLVTSRCLKFQLLRGSTLQMTGWLFTSSVERRSWLTLIISQFLRLLVPWSSYWHLTSNCGGMTSNYRFPNWWWVTFTYSYFYLYAYWPLILLPFRFLTKLKWLWL